MTSAADSDCLHPEVEPLYGGLLSRCSTCGWVATAAQPSFEYQQAYFTAEGKGGYDFDSAFARAQDEARFVPELERLEAQGLRGSALDIGCATGSFLWQAQRRGWSVAGVELADFAREVAQRRLGIEVQPSLDRLPSGARYGVVTLHHVLEHIPAPRAFLRDQVRPRVGRRLLVEVPNFGSLAARVHGPRWRDLRPDQHLQHFTPRTLSALLIGAGFRPVAVATLWEPLWSLRTAADVLGLLAGALRRPRPVDAARGLAGVADVSTYAPPRGWKRVAVEGSRWVFLPLVAALRRAGLGERLVVEAEPEPEGQPEVTG